MAVHAATPCPIPVKQAMIERWGHAIQEYYAGTEGGGTLIRAKEWLEHKGSVGRNWSGGTLHRPFPATGANQVWAYDFVFDASANGQQLKCLTVIDEFTRECLAIDVAGSIRSERVIEVLSKLVSVRGAPRHLRSDNGPEFVSRAVLQWLLESGIETAPIDSGKPWQNGANESFNGKFRDECLGMQWFKNRIDAKVAIEDWRQMYNEVRPHSSLRNLTPSEYARRTSTTSAEQAVF